MDGRKPLCCLKTEELLEASEWSKKQNLDPETLGYIPTLLIVLAACVLLATLLYLNSTRPTKQK